jgi:hypothetical protein
VRSGTVLALGIVLALGGCCSARIRGVVRDQATGQPIAGATVRAGEVTTNADGSGFYDLADLECEDFWRVMVVAPGYHLMSASVVPEPGEDPELLIRDFPLVPETPSTGAPTTVPATSPRPTEEDAEERSPPEIDYRPRHAIAPPIQRLPLDDDEVAAPPSRVPAAPGSSRHAAVLPGDADDNRLYIKLTEEQSQALLQHMQTHGSESMS